MTPFKIGLHLPSLRLPFRKALVAASELGVAAVEIDLRHDFPAGELSGTGVRQVRKWLDDAGLTIATADFYTRGGYDEPERIEARVAATKEAMTLAYDLGARTVINHFGNLDPETSLNPENPLRDALADLARHGQRCGVTLLGTTVGVAPTHLQALLATLPEVGLGVNLDPAGLVTSGASVDGALDLLGSRIHHVHARDAARENASGRRYETDLGRGSVDFAALVGRLEELGYAGPLTLRRESSVEPESLRQAVRYLKNLAT